MSVTCTYGVTLNVTESSAANTAGTATVAASVPSGGTSVASGALASGTGSGQADKEWSYANASFTGATTFDLTAMPGPLGAVSFARIKVIYIENRSTTSGQSLAVGNAASNPWAGPVTPGTALVEVGPSGYWHQVSPLATGWVVTGGSKALKVDAGANTYGLVIVIVGASA